jgi:hypothetical protein
MQIIVMAGDWKQLLPVIEDGDANQQYWASVKNSTWFTEGRVTVHRLTVNQRLEPGQEAYRRKLKCWGTGITADQDHKERLDEEMVVRDEQDLIDHCFGDALDDPIANLKRIRGSVILTPLNDDTFRLNDRILV